jgi:hypothetical protein
MLTKVGETSIVGLLTCRRKKTSRDSALVPVIAYALTAHPFLGTIICAGTFFKITLFSTFHILPLLIPPHKGGWKYN